ncbi:MAG TPA: hypothetical protein VFT22_19425, partial [Kofleriaceae bacterium]|nr:hypothetical protein [Kofleriaceae bacterium]
VQPGTGKISRSQPLPPQVIDLSSNMLPDSWMVDPNTDLLRSHRLRSIRNAAIAIGAMIAVSIAIFVISSRSQDAASRTPAPPPVRETAAEIPDAAEPPIDAPTGPTRDDIVALSRYGFFSIAATAKTQIYVDNNKIGDTPLTRLPLPPGPHKVKAVGPRGKVKQINITIYGGRDTDEGTINW